MQPKVAIQYIAYWSPEAAGDIDAAMKSLCTLDYPRDRVRLVIIDNPSPHGTARAQLEEKWMGHEALPEIVYVESPENDGFAGGHNRGYEAIKSWEPEYLYLLNQDAQVEEKTLEHILGYAKAQVNTPIVQSLIVSAQDQSQVDSYGNVLHYLGFGYQDPDGHRPHFYVSGAATLIDTSVIDAIGGLFETDYFMYHDDVDICWRARLAGYDIGVAKDSRVLHRYEFSRSIQKFYWMERNRLLTHLTHLKLATLALILPMLLVMEAGTFLFAIKSGWWKKKLAVYGHFFKTSTWADVFERRRLIASIRRVDDKDLLLLMAPTIEAQVVANSLLDHVANPLLTLYYRFLRVVVRW